MAARPSADNVSSDPKGKKAVDRKQRVVDGKQARLLQGAAETNMMINYSLGVKRKRWEESLQVVPKTPTERMQQQAAREPVVISDDDESEISEEE